MSAIDDLPPLREVIARYELRARKSLGQNFLLDLNLTARIARASGPLTGMTVVEVGPGPGGLTRALLSEGASHVVAIERDERCIAALEEIGACYPGRLTIVPGDALEFDHRPYLAGERARVIANLPYVTDATIFDRSLEIQKEPRIAVTGACGEDGLGVIRGLIEETPSGRRMALEHDTHHGPAMRELLRAATTLQDYEGDERVTVGFAP